MGYCGCNSGTLRLHVAYQTAGGQTMSTWILALVMIAVVTGLGVYFTRKHG